MAAYAELRIELILNDRFIDPIEEGFDVTVRIGALPDSSLVARKLAPARRVLVASPAYLEQTRDAEDADDLVTPPRADLRPFAGGAAFRADASRRDPRRRRSPPACARTTATSCGRRRCTATALRCCRHSWSAPTSRRRQLKVVLPDYAPTGLDVYARLSRRTAISRRRRGCSSTSWSSASGRSRSGIGSEETIASRRQRHCDARNTPSLKKNRNGVVPLAPPSNARHLPSRQSVPPCTGTASNSMTLA